MSEAIPVSNLAEELKLDTKRLIDEIRREGVDLQQASDSVTKELAEKIRRKYVQRERTVNQHASNALNSATKENVADHEATIDHYIAEMERIQQEMDEDQEEILALQLETRTMLAELVKVA
jgi:hypothetical protein